VEKTYLRCEDAFPTVLRRSEIAEVYVVEISPLEKALEDVTAKTSELETLEKKYLSIRKVSTGKINTNRLSMALNGAVDAPTEGGIPLYKSTFFAPEYAAAHADQQAAIDELRQAIDAQVTVLFRCIRLHAQLCPPEMKSFHETLERFFVQNFGEEIAQLDLDIRKLGEAPANSFDRQVGTGDEDGEENERRPTERTLSRGFTLGMGAMDRAGAANGFAAAPDGRQDLQPNAQYGKRGAAAQSPLQRHIAFLTRQAEAPANVDPAPAAVVAQRKLTADSSYVAAAAGGYGETSAASNKVLPPISEDMLGGVANMPSAPLPTNFSKHSLSRADSSYSIPDTASKQATPQKQGPGHRLSKFMGGVGRRKAFNA
jgi:dedicator of cytokinesis protein 3